MISFHRKIAKDTEIALSDWSILNDYRYKAHSHYTHSFYVSVKNFRSVEDLKTLSDRFPISALTRDRTLILTWDIETYNSCGMGDFPEILDDCASVFMICMTLH